MSNYSPGLPYDLMGYELFVFAAEHPKIGTLFGSGDTKLTQVLGELSGKIADTENSYNLASERANIRTAHNAALVALRTLQQYDIETDLVGRIEQMLYNRYTVLLQGSTPGPEPTPP